MTLLEQHLQLQARLKVSASAVTHYRNQFLEYRTTTTEHLSTSQAQLQATSDQLAAQVHQDDSVLKALILEITPYANSAFIDPGRHLRRLIGQLLRIRPNPRPQNFDY